MTSKVVWGKNKSNCGDIVYMLSHKGIAWTDFIFHVQVHLPLLVKELSVFGEVQGQFWLNSLNSTHL